MPNISRFIEWLNLNCADKYLVFAWEELFNNCSTIFSRNIWCVGFKYELAMFAQYIARFNDKVIWFENKVNCEFENFKEIGVLS